MWFSEMFGWPKETMCKITIFRTNISYGKHIILSTVFDRYQNIKNMFEYSLFEAKGGYCS